MFRIVLIEPEIPQNTGNIARLCAVSKIPLLLVGKLGFHLDDKYLKRAGMDYWKFVDCRHIPVTEEYFGSVKRFAAISTKGRKLYSEINIEKDIDIDLIFGNESSGLPPFVYEKYADNLYRIPMLPEFRSLNLSSAASIVSYHLLYKSGFPNLR